MLFRRHKGSSLLLRVHTAGIGPATDIKAALPVLGENRYGRPKGLSNMKRRNFILALGGALSVWPATGRAQRSNVPTIGFLSPRSPEDSAHLVAAFRRGLGETGLTEGQNVSVEYRWRWANIPSCQCLRPSSCAARLMCWWPLEASRPCWPPKPRPQRYQSLLYLLVTRSKVA
jgi:hypothetical protein